MAAVNKPTPAPPVVPPDPPVELPPPSIPPDLHHPVIPPPDPPVELPPPGPNPSGDMMGVLNRIAGSLERLVLATMAGGAIAQHTNHDADSALSIARKMNAGLAVK